MSQHTTVKCDGCGKVKQETNHWWVVVIAVPGVFVVKNQAHVGNEKKYDMCGQACVLDSISKLMGGGECGRR